MTPIINRLTKQKEKLEIRYKYSFPVTQEDDLKTALRN